MRPDNKQLPSSVGHFTTADKRAKSSCTAFTTPIDPRTGQAAVWENIKQLYPPDIRYSSQATMELKVEKNRPYLKAKTNLGSNFESVIQRKPATDRSDIKGEIKSWEDYKAFVSNLVGQKNIFRGQRQPWKLRTGFHRKGRYNLTRFLAEDVPLLYRHLSAKTSHVFNLTIPNENDAFLNLVQHHGYPTPLLDWTFSPYVAAFFAFRNASKAKRKNDVSRVYIFDQGRWKRDWPQQGKEDQKSYTYLRAVDIPAPERNKTMMELSFMGITAGSMFPGLDGACEELRERMF